MKKNLVLMLSMLVSGVLPAFSQSSVLEGTKPKLEPKQLYQVFTKEDWERSSRAKPEDLGWFRDARFGLFIHWGPVSLTGAELGWSKQARKGPDHGKGEIPDEVYDNLYKRFNPAKFNAEAWVKMAQGASMKYIVFVTKHLDGFCMWDSQYTDHKITNAPIKRDLLKELADACHKAGMPLGLYYCQRDFFHPDYFGERHDRYIRYLHNQVRELLTQYRKVSILWLDAAWWGGMFKAGDWDSERLYQMARQLQPGILINNRASIPGDFDTPELHVGGFQNDRPWETCMTIGTQWSWKPNDEVKSQKDLLQLLARAATGDGNLLLNLGPRADGTFEPVQIERILQMGKWLKKYGRTIYQTRGGPFQPGDWGGSTHKGRMIYLHLLETGGDIALPPLKQRIVASRVLTGGSAKLIQTERAIQISIPRQDVDPIDTIVELSLEAPVEALVER